MVNKVLAAYVAADLLFVATGAVMVGFSVIAKNTMYDTTSDGYQTVRNLLYQEFPLTGTFLYHMEFRWPSAVLLWAVRLQQRSIAHFTVNLMEN